MLMRHPIELPAIPQPKFLKMATAGANALATATAIVDQMQLL